MPFFSIVMPVYNGEKTLARAIRSVLNQYFIDFELIIVNDGSTDGSEAVIQPFLSDERIVYLSQENQGASKARNTAFDKAQGDYFAFIDADDVWLPEKLSVEFQTLHHHQFPVGFVYSGYYVFDEGDQLFNLPPVHRDNGMIFDKVLWQEGMIIPSALVIHREIAAAVGGFPEHGNHEDWYFSLRMARVFPGYPTEKRLMLYQHSLTGRGRQSKFQDVETALQRYVFHDPVLADTLTPSLFEQFLQRQKKTLLCSLLMYGYWENAKTLYPQVAQDSLKKDLKGLLTRLSMALNINLLAKARVVYQAAIRTYYRRHWDALTRFLLTAPDPKTSSQPAPRQPLNPSLAQR